MRELTEKISEFQVRTNSMEVVGSIPAKKKLKDEPRDISLSNYLSVYPGNRTWN